VSAVPSIEAPSPTRRVVVALSGGVDSAVAAALLVEAGWDVVGVTLRLEACHQPAGARSCCGPEAVVRARAVAGHLSIPHYVLECVRSFEHDVLRPAWEGYARGRAPSLCLLCNEHIKFGFVRAWARKLGAFHVATGHCARVETDAAGRSSLARGLPGENDDSFLLAGLDEATLRSAIFPVGGLSKAEVRAHARRLGLPNADAPESQDLCLAGPGEAYAETLRRRFGALRRPGLILDEDGRVVGRHRGIHGFAVGQRRGLRAVSSEPRWVTAIEPDAAKIVVTADERRLDRRLLVVGDVRWRGGSAPAGRRPCGVQVRPRHAVGPAQLESRVDGTVAVTCEEPLRAVAPGQAVVFYDDSRVMGRGWVKTAG
jgi:tRNA-specific 2-thiouridylase